MITSTSLEHLHRIVICCHILTITYSQEFKLFCSRSSDYSTYHLLRCFISRFATEINFQPSQEALVDPIISGNYCACCTKTSEFILCGSWGFHSLSCANTTLSRSKPDNYPTLSLSSILINSESLTLTSYNVLTHWMLSCNHLPLLWLIWEM